MNIRSIKQQIHQPVSINFLVYFRIVAGVFFSLEILNDWIIGDIYEYISPQFNFTFLWTPWLTPWPPLFIYLHYIVMIAAGFMVALGFYYRFFTIILFFGYTSWFLMEKTEYVNHTYLYCLVIFWLIFLPANRFLSLDALRGRVNKLQLVPAWVYYLLIFHMAIVYFFGGIAKLNPDWLAASPMRYLGPAKANVPVVGYLLNLPWSAYVLSYGGLLFDLFIVPVMLVKRLRIYGFMVACFFHLSNVMIFGLATFPWFSILMTTLFFGPSFPGKLPYINRWFIHKQFNVWKINAGYKSFALKFIGVYMLLHLLIPWRHYLYPGHASWTEEGHDFSWHMMLRAKSGYTKFTLEYENGDREVVDQADYLTPTQYRKMTGKPDLLLQFAHFLSEEFAMDGKKPKVYVSSKVSLNGRKSQEMVNPTTNLAAEKRHLGHYDWILPLTEPLPPIRESSEEQH